MTSVLSFHCPSCGQKQNIARSALGGVHTCKGCKELLELPSSEQILGKECDLQTFLNGKRTVRHLAMREERRNQRRLPQNNRRERQQDDNVTGPKYQMRTTARQVACAPLLAKLERKAKRGDVEVEDVLAVATLGDAGAVPVLEAMREKYRWPDATHVGRSRVVPLGRWARVVCRYLRDGTEGMADLALADDTPELDREMAISVLEEIKTAGSVRALIRVTSGTKTATVNGRSRARDVIDAFNFILSFSKGGEIVLKDSEVQTIRNFIHGFLDIATTENEISSAYCALRGVGNEDSLARIESRRPLRGAFKGVEAVACKAIKKNLKRRA